MSFFDWFRACKSTFRGHRCARFADHSGDHYVRDNDGNVIAQWSSDDYGWSNDCPTCHGTGK